MIGLPGVCVVCRAPVVWSGIDWCDRGAKRRHACRTGLAKCGFWMTQAKMRCARPYGHGRCGPLDAGHRTQYALDNARAMRTGIGA